MREFMHRSFLFIKIEIFVLLSVLWLSVIEVQAVTSCSGMTYIIGQEIVAECGEGDAYRYVVTDIHCVNNVVVKGTSQSWFQGGGEFTPDYVQSAVVSAGAYSSGKVFANSQKTHFVSVTNTFAKYNGYLDGIALKPLAFAPTLHVDLFDHIFVVPTDAPYDLDRDDDGYHVCLDCNDSDASVHPGAAEVCGDGMDNDCNGTADCDDSACAEDQTCQGARSDIIPAEHPRDCHLNIDAN